MVIKPVWTTPCVSDSATDPPRPEINTDDIEFSGGSSEHRFDVAGTYPYLDLRHPTQKGTVIVQSLGSDSAVVQITDSTPTGISPSSVTIRSHSHSRSTGPPGAFVQRAGSSELIS